MVTSNVSYTKKMMAHFANPHNMGQLKDPDGIGKAGNPVCLTIDQSIHVGNDTKRIQEVEINDLVISHTNQYNRVDKKVSRKYSGKVLSLKNRLGTVHLTPEHMVFAIKIPKTLRFLRTKHKKSLSPAWYHAYEIEKGDMAVYPVLKEIRDVNSLSIRLERLKFDFRSKALPDKIALTPGLLRLFGYFVSEGNIQDRPSKTYVSFTLNINEKEIADDIISTSKKLFGITPSVKVKPERKTLIVYLYGARIARAFKQLFGNGAQSKTLPDFLMKLPPKKQKHLIYGLWKGDGYVNLNRDGARGGYATVSYGLAQQLKTLLIRQGILPSMYDEKERVVKGVRHRRAFRLHVGQRDSLLKLCRILRLHHKSTSFSQQKGWIDGDYAYIPVVDIHETHYSGNVYNLEVADSHSFASDAFCLHNCGDVMHLHIKVKDDRITDIKFQTLGCASAIATSSMVTDLAKGKTVDEAWNITNAQVASELGGLPPIKMHCSVLAEQALHAAIEDYRNKHPNEPAKAKPVVRKSSVKPKARK